MIKLNYLINKDYYYEWVNTEIASLLDWVLWLNSLLKDVLWHWEGGDGCFFFCFSQPIECYMVGFIMVWLFMHHVGKLSNWPSYLKLIQKQYCYFLTLHMGRYAKLYIWVKMFSLLSTYVLIYRMFYFISLPYICD